MGEPPVDKARALDGVVGLPSEAATAPPSLSSLDSQVYVSVSGDARYAPWAMGLEDDLRLLGQAFAEGGASLCREMVKGVVKRSSSKSQSADRYEEIDVALIGLKLDSRGEEELRDLIRLLVGERIARAGSRR
jgi:hypothetical protein